MTQPDPIAVEIIRPKTDVEIGTNAIVMAVITTPLRALVVWWLLHYLPVPDLNYWQCLALVVTVWVLGSTLARPASMWTRERPQQKTDSDQS